MLQQTRVAAVIPYYEKFLGRFPTVEKLAAAREASVLAAWSGLGYYRRARMLHATSKRVVKQHSGQFPRSRDELATFPGIGKYTSAAIASIAFSEPVAAVDGNVRRVLQRVLGGYAQGQELWDVAQQWLNHANPGDSNQSIMELGATVCLPREPNCLMCPVTRQCATRGALPKIKRRSRLQNKTICYTLDQRKGFVFLIKRDLNSSLMPGMWELPQTPESKIAPAPCLRLRHSITTTEYEILIIRSSAPDNLPGKWIDTRRLSTLPLTGLARKILRAVAVI